MSDELVSCVMATGNRNRFFPQALRCFLAQTYWPRELVVVDDGEIPVGPLCRGVPGVKYVRLTRRTPTGAKLNLGIEQAAGAILQKVDDDDYYGPGFLETAVGRLEASPARRAIAAWDCFLVHLAGSPALHFSGHGWMAGGTLCFRRALWESAPFRNVAKDEDALFLEDHAHRPHLRIRTAPEQYILVRHGANTWNRLPDGARVDGFAKSLELYPKPIAQVVREPESARFYASLRPQPAAAVAKAGPVRASTRSR